MKIWIPPYNLAVVLHCDSLTKGWVYWMISGSLNCGSGRIFFDLSDHLECLSAVGDPLEILSGCVDFEFFHETLDAGLKYSRGKRNVRPPYDPVAMLKVLVFAARHNMNDERMEFLIRDRLGWMRHLLRVNG